MAGRLISGIAGLSGLSTASVAQTSSAGSTPVPAATSPGASGPTAQSVSPPPAPIYPGAQWMQASDVRPYGFSASGLAALTPLLQSLDTTALMVVVDGAVVYEYGDVSTVSYLASCRKSILAILYGKYVASGRIRLDQTLAELGVDDVGGLLPVERSATIDDLLTARSGIFHPASYLGDATSSAPPRGSQKPGHYYIYNNWDFNAAGGVFEQVTGKGIYEELGELAGQLQMQDFDLRRQKKEGDATRSHFLGYPINLSTRDMARVAYLMLRNGNWKGRQIVPKDWIGTITSLVTPVSEINPPFWRGYAEGSMWGYGRLWWVWDDHNLLGPFAGAYTGWGVSGQFITVLPSLRMAIAHKTVPGKDASGRRRDVTVMQYQAVLMHIIAASAMGGVDTRR
jgi:CubicO group peptidase (beta-lactamase class C family)